MKEICDVKLQMHLLELEITTKCNLNCKHCYNRENKNLDMPLNDIISMLKFAEQYEVDTVVISGGEACLHPKFEELCSYIKNNKPKIHRLVIQSNGIISMKNIEALKIFDSIHLSFDLDDNGIRSISAKQQIDTAKKFINNGIYTYLFATVHSKNINYLDEIVNIANNNRIDIGFNLICDTGLNKEYLLSPHQKIDAIKKLLVYYKNKQILNFKHPMTSIFENRCSQEFIGIKGGCTAGIASCVILPNGDVAPCPFLRIKCGNIYQDNLKNIWFTSKELYKLRYRQDYDEPCNKCEYLSFCGGCRKEALQKTGKLNGADLTCIKSLLL